MNFSRTNLVQLFFVTILLSPHNFACADTILRIDPNISTPRQIGEAARREIETDQTEIILTPMNGNLRGPSVRLIRSDIEKSIHHESSPEEIWPNTFFDTGKKSPPPKTSLKFSGFRLTLDNQVAFSDDTVTHRGSILSGIRGPSFFGIIDTGGSLRLNLTDNLNGANAQNNEHDFAKRRVTLDTLYVAATHSFNNDLHLSLIGGYLEEMRGGAGGEILYRPFSSRLALGLEGWQTWRRDPDSTLNYQWTNDTVFTGHLNGWYELPFYDLTLNTKIGRYLAEDFGGTLGLQKKFRNGAALEGYVTATDDKGPGLFSGSTNILQGLRFNIPLGQYKHIPNGTSIALRAEPFARDAGASLKSPLPLYEATTPLTKGHMIRHWNEITP